MKEIIIPILVVLFGAALTAMSFCIYYLVKPLNTAALVAICVVDFLYNLLCTCLLYKYIVDTNKWLLKGFLLAVGYIVGFIIVAVVFFTLIIAIEFLKNNILGIVLYAFFTAPSIFVVLALFILFMAFY